MSQDESSTSFFVHKKNRNSFSKTGEDYEYVNSNCECGDSDKIYELKLKKRLSSDQIRDINTNLRTFTSKNLGGSLCNLKLINQDISRNSTGSVHREHENLSVLGKDSSDFFSGSNNEQQTNLDTSSEKDLNFNEILNQIEKFKSSLFKGSQSEKDNQVFSSNEGGSYFDGSNFKILNESFNIDVWKNREDKGESDENYLSENKFGSLDAVHSANKKAFQELGESKNSDHIFSKGNNYDSGNSKRRFDEINSNNFDLKLKDYSGNNANSNDSMDLIHETFREISQEHLVHILNKLCTELSINKIWMKTIFEFSNKAVKNLLTDFDRGGSMDILSYLKIKTVPGGSILDSEYVGGLTFTGIRLHKLMPNRLKNPKILLFNYSLEYEKQINSLTSIDKLKKSEKEMLSFLYEKVIFCKPDIIFVRGISRITMDYFMHSGIKVIVKVNENTIITLSRITGASILNKIETIRQVDLGCASLFEERNLSGSWGKTSLLTVSGSFPSLYATILLRGSPLEILKRVKKCLQYSVYSCYNMKLENALFLDLRCAAVKLAIKLGSNDSINESKPKLRAKIQIKKIKSRGHIRNSGNSNIYSNFRKKGSKNNLVYCKDDSYSDEIGKTSNDNLIESNQNFNNSEFATDYFEDPLTGQYHNIQYPHFNQEVSKSLGSNSNSNSIDNNNNNNNINSSFPNNKYFSKNSCHNVDLEKYAFFNQKIPHPHGQLLSSSWSSFIPDESNKNSSSDIIFPLIRRPPARPELGRSCEIFDENGNSKNSNYQIRTLSVGYRSLGLNEKFKPVIDPDFEIPKGKGVCERIPRTLEMINYLKKKRIKNLKGFSPQRIIYIHSLYRPSSNVKSQYNNNNNNNINNEKKNNKIENNSYDNNNNNDYNKKKVNINNKYTNTRNIIENYKREDTNSGNKNSNNNTNNAKNSSASKNLNSDYFHCFPFEIQIIDYYTSNDMTFGHFLEYYCFSDRVRCSNLECQRPISEHNRTIMNKKGRIDIFIRKFSDLFPNSNFSLYSETGILTWSECKNLSNQNSIISPLSREACAFSLGKIFEFYFYGNCAKCRSCSISTNREHLHYFFKDKKVVIFEFSPVKHFKVSTPSHKILIERSLYVPFIKAELEKVFQLTKKIYSIVQSKLLVLQDLCIAFNRKEHASDIELLFSTQKYEKIALNQALISEAEKLNENKNVFNVFRLRHSLYKACIQWDDVLFDIGKRIKNSWKNIPKEMNTHNSFTSDSQVKNYASLTKNENSSQTDKDSSSLINKYSQTQTSNTQNYIGFESDSKIQEDQINTNFHGFGNSNIIRDDKLHSDIQMKVRENINKNANLDSTHTATKNSESKIYDSKKDKDETVLSLPQYNLLDESSLGIKILNKSEDIGKKNSFTQNDTSIDNIILNEINDMDTDKYQNQLSKITLLNSVGHNHPLYVENFNSKKKSMISENIPVDSSDSKLKKKLELFDYYFGQKGHILHSDILENERCYIFHNSSPDGPIVAIYANEPSSIIAYWLMNPKYYEDIQKFKYPPPCESYYYNEKYGKSVHNDTECDETDNNNNSTKGLYNTQFDIISSKRELLKESEPKNNTKNIHEDKDENIRNKNDKNPIDAKHYNTKNAFFNGVNSEYSNNTITKKNPNLNKIFNNVNISKKIITDYVDSNNENKFLDEQEKISMDFNNNENLDNLTDIDFNDISPENLKFFKDKSGTNNYQKTKFSDSSKIFDNKINCETAFNGLRDPEITNLEFELRSSQIWGGPTVTIQCKIYYSRQFAWLRNLLSIDEDLFTQSISRCRKWKAKGGKSNSKFILTLDDRFILKQIQPIELESFLDFAPSYFDYISEALFFQVPTSLCKILGVFSVSLVEKGLKNPVKFDLIIQENLFYGKSITKTFDLKGSLRSRYARPETPSDTDLVLLDENLLESMHDDPICVDMESKVLLLTTIWNDALFLSSLNVMDYSLLVGVDKDGGRLHLGIIDYMRTYTWDKQLETWVKSGILGVYKGSIFPTIISPEEYKKRFRIAIWKYFILLPSILTNLIYVPLNINKF